MGWEKSGSPAPLVFADLADMRGGACHPSGAAAARGSSGLAWCICARRPAVVGGESDPRPCGPPPGVGALIDRAQSKHPAPPLTDNEPRQA